jgi:hypothetical protein
MANRKARRAKKRRTVKRTERVKPPPEAAQHQRPWPLQQLLKLGAADGGIEADEFEAALQMVEAFKSLTAELGMRSTDGTGAERGGLVDEFAKAEMSDRDAERCALWFAWADRLPPTMHAALLVEQIEDRVPIVSVPLLRHACHLWEATARDQGRAQPVESTSYHQQSPLDSAPGFGVTLQVLRNLQTTQPRPAVTTGPRAALPMRPSSPFARNR